MRFMDLHVGAVVRPTGGSRWGHDDQVVVQHQLELGEVRLTLREPSTGRTLTLCASANAFLTGSRVGGAPEQGSSGYTPETMTNWKDVELFWAGGGTRASRWDRAQGRAVATEDGDDLTSPEITDEHLRALAEIRGEGSCANWFTDRDLTGSGPQRDTIDWAGFPDTCTLCGELLCLADPDLDDAERGPLCSKCAEQASGTGNAQG